MPQTGKYGPGDVAVASGAYGPEDVVGGGKRTAAPDSPGFGETFWEQLVGDPHPLQNIGETLKMSVENPRGAYAGAMEFLRAAPVGLGKAALPILKAAAYTTPPGMAYAAATRGRGLPKLEDVTALGGGKAYAKAGELAGARRYREAAEAAAAGVVQAGAWFLGGLLKPRLKPTISKIESATEPITLQSGEKLPMTLGMQEPAGNVASVERISGQLIGGQRFRGARAVEHAEASQVMKNILGRAAADAELGPTALPQGVSRSFQVVADSIRQAASPYYERVIAAMKEPAAVQPLIENVAATADKLLSDTQLSKVLVTAGDARPAIEESLKRIAAFRHGVPPESIALAFDGASVWEFFDAAKSRLMALNRTKLTANEHRIVGNVVRELDASMTKALAETDKAMKSAGLPSLEASYRRGAGLVAQGYALKRVADAIEAATTGTPTEIQAGVKGLKIKPEVISGKQLEEAVRGLSEPLYPGGPGRIKIALPRIADEESFAAIAGYLARSGQLGGESMAAKFGLLAGIAAVGGLGLGALTGFYVGRPLLGIIGGMAPEVGAYMISLALTTKTGPRLVSAFLKAVPRSAAEAQLAKQLAALEQQDNEGTPKK